MAYNRMARGRRIPSRVQIALRRMPLGTQYMGEDETYFYFVEPGANPSLDGLTDMFTRMLKFTPKSFTPGNIYKGFINTTLTAATGGLYQVLPKNLKKTVYEVGKVAVPVIAGGVLAYTAGPAVMGYLMPKLSAAGSLLGKAASAVGGPLMSMMGKMSNTGQATMAGGISPEQIAQWDQTGSMPASLIPLMERALQQSLPPSSGNASLYDPSTMAAREMQLAEQGQESFDWGTIMKVGIPAIAGIYFLARR